MKPSRNIGIGKSGEGKEDGMCVLSRWEMNGRKIRKVVAICGLGCFVLSQKYCLLMLTFLLGAVVVSIRIQTDNHLKIFIK